MAKDEPKEDIQEEANNAPEVPEVKEESQADESPVEDVEEESEEESEEVAEPEVKEEPEEEKPPSRREQLRVQDLLKKYGPPKDTPIQSKGPDFRDKVEANEEVYKTLQDTAQQFGQDQYNQGLERAKYFQWETLLNVDEPQVRAKYPQLDPSSEDYHPAIHNAMASKYARFVGYNPGDPEKGIPRSVQNSEIRYADFVEAEMEFADEIASQRVVRTTENIARQAAQTGLRPDGSSAKRLNLNKAPEDMTDEELDAVISQIKK